MELRNEGEEKWGRGEMGVGRIRDVRVEGIWGSLG